VKCCHLTVTSADNYRPHSVVARAQVLLESARPVPGAEEELQVNQTVVQKMCNDEAKVQIQGDSLIINFQSVLL